MKVPFAAAVLSLALVVAAALPASAGVKFAPAPSAPAGVKF